MISIGQWMNTSTRLFVIRDSNLDEVINILRVEESRRSLWRILCLFYFVPFARYVHSTMSFRMEIQQKSGRRISIARVSKRMLPMLHLGRTEAHLHQFIFEIVSVSHIHACKRFLHQVLVCVCDASPRVITMHARNICVSRLLILYVCIFLYLPGHRVWSCLSYLRPYLLLHVLLLFRFSDNHRRPQGCRPQSQMPLVSTGTLSSYWS